MFVLYIQHGKNWRTRMNCVRKVLSIVYTILQVTGSYYLSIYVLNSFNLEQGQSIIEHWNYIVMLLYSILYGCYGSIGFSFYFLICGNNFDFPSIMKTFIYASIFLPVFMVLVIIISSIVIGDETSEVISNPIIQFETFLLAELSTLIFFVFALFFCMPVWFCTKIHSNN